MLQAPLILAGGIALAWGLRRVAPRAAPWWAWFLVACLLHAALDVFTHHDDGPLILFPFDWSTRFHSPISYWDRSRFGGGFARVELALDAVLLGYLVGPRLVGMVRRRAASVLRRRSVTRTGAGPPP